MMDRCAHGAHVATICIVYWCSPVNKFRFLLCIHVFYCFKTFTFFIKMYQPDGGKHAPRCSEAREPWSVVKFIQTDGRRQVEAVGFCNEERDEGHARFPLPSVGFGSGDKSRIGVGSVRHLEVA